MTVEQRSIDSLADEHRFSPDFIKIDVEGAELGVLAGAQHTIRRCRPTVVIAAYHETDHPDLIRQFIAESIPGYRCTLRRAAYGTENEVVAVPIASTGRGWRRP